MLYKAVQPGTILRPIGTTYYLITDMPGWVKDEAEVTGQMSKEGKGIDI